MFRAEKVVASLPSTLAPDTLYVVRTGVGFDLYVSDATGSIAHPLNASIPPPGTAQTGDLKYAMRTTAPDGWIFATGTIGSAASSATTRANDDTADLYKLLFEDFDDVTAPLTGGGGPEFGRAAFGNNWESAFNLNYPITIPDCRGRILATQDDMGGSAANIVTVAGSGVNGTVVGATGGEETHLLTANESGLRAHTHSYVDRYHNTTTSVGGSGSSTRATGLTSGNYATGANAAANAVEAHNNMPPVIVFPLFVKL